MLRFVGILIGSALAIGFLVIVIGRPQLSASDSSGSVSELSSSGSVSELVINPEPIENSHASGPDLPNTERVTDPKPQGLETDPELGARDAALIEQVFAPETERQEIVPVDAEPVVAEHWYAFWSPFRSEIAAQGFVDRLQQTTGIDYRVVRVKTGVYEVAFSYTDDIDIEAKLERIASATGLDMSGT